MTENSHPLPSQRVFISYRSQDPDASLAKVFYEHLKDAGHLPFMAAESIRLGENWPEGVDKELEKSDYFLLLLSEKSATSEMVIEEVSSAKRLQGRNSNNKPIIVPIRVNFPFSAPLSYDLRAYTARIQQEKWNSDTDTPIILAKVLSLLANNETPATVEPETTLTYAVETYDKPPLPAAELELPEGMIRLASPFYVQPKSCKSKCDQEIEKPGALIRIKAPRQMGKTSLLARISYYGKQQGYQTVSLDFSQFEENIFQDLKQFLKRFCASVARQLKISQEKVKEHLDNDSYGPIENCCQFFEDVIFKDLTVPLILGLDKIDLIFPYSDTAKEFLKILRLWHQNAIDKNAWKKLRLIIVHSTESYVKMDINHSPFNVGLGVKLPEFTSAQVLELAQRHGLDWNNGEVQQLMGMVGGHPYLIRLGLYNIAQQGITLSQLLQKAPTDEGIYGEHLRRHLWNLQQHPELLNAFQQVINSPQSINLETREKFKLNGMGLVDLEDNKVKLRYEQLYRPYFRDCLNL
ncbi:TIR protein [Gloeothece citriformis PCC 7424]|uniref:TIR protein n=1 Tax=Gloeothece citriformis (strain PCC 7424) TaxID=65393 RepID=B7K751_GLOC7|nr:AAA-like domain-containing protein [Gloeothece citriformis]ACK69619.1 TIR protein [Gloeothece citriformis PCC 7424]